MKLEITRKDFIKSWSLAERFVDTRSPNSSVQGIYVSAAENGQVTLKATDLKTSVKCEAGGVNVIEQGEAVIPVLIFGNMLRKAETDELTIDINSERGFLRAGKSRTKFAVIHTEQFPALPDSSNGEKICVINSEILGRIITEESSAASLPTDFPKYIGTCLLRTKDGSIKAVATDGKRLSLSQKECNAIEVERDILLPAPAIKELAKYLTTCKDKDVEIKSDERTAWFFVDGVEFSVRIIDATFPIYERILNDNIQASLNIKSGDLALALERIDIIAKTTPQHVMALSLNPNGEIKITARSPEKGIASEEFLAEIEGNPMLVGFNVDYFLDGLRILGDGEINIEFSGEESQTRMKRKDGDDFLYMLMPARLSPQDKFTEEELQ